MADISLELLLLQLMTGLALGAVYALLAVGLSLIFGMLTVVNFAHGAFFMVGAFFGVYFLGLTGSFWFSLVLTPLSVGAIGSPLAVRPPDLCRQRSRQTQRQPRPQPSPTRGHHGPWMSLR